MRRFVFTLSVVGLLAAFGALGPVHADQRDSRLDTLFGQLHQTVSLTEANDIVEQIWVVWIENEDQSIHETMLRGVDAMAGSDFGTALALFDDVVGKKPDFAEAWNKRATVYYLMGRLDDSMADVETTLDLEPRHFGALSGKGLILMAKGEFLSAIEAFEHALETNPHMPSIRLRIEMLKEILNNSET